MNTNHSRLHARRPDGFTLIELMLATGLALFLLLGLVKIISMVNTTFADTRVLIDLQNQCRSAQMLLQEDLSHISVIPQAPRPAEMDEGFLCLGTKNRDYVHDATRFSRGNITLVDSNMLDTNNGADFAAFTVFNRERPFTFTAPNSNSRQMQTPYAEAIWFVYKNDLYRITVPFVTSPERPRDYNAGNANAPPHVRMITPGMLGDMPKRSMYDVFTGGFQSHYKPYMVLPNVIMFKVQLYDPREERYRDIDDLNQSQYYDPQTFNHPSSSLAGIYYDSGSTLSYLGCNSNSNDNSVYVNSDIYDTEGYRPPTTAFVPGMRIIVRAFDPDSGTVREFRVGRDFRTR